MKDFNEYLNKFTGCLLGGAAGDALGYPIEFYREDEIFEEYGENGLQEFDLCFDKTKAVFSDDTQMTLFTAEGILHAKNPYDRFDFILGMFDAYQAWYRTQFPKKWPQKEKIELCSIPELNQRRAPGNTCISALQSKRIGSIEEPLNNSKGCGGVMRVAPIGLFYSPDKQSIETTDLFGARAAALTHGHPMGYLSAAGLVHIVNLAIYKPEMTLNEIVNDMLTTVPKIFNENSPEFCADFKSLIEKAVTLANQKDEIRDLDAIHQLGEGWVGEETLAIAIYCALRHEDDFDKALTASVNHNGDSDSTGAVTGNILGAYKGVQAIPQKYLEKLELREVIEKTAEKLAAQQNK